MSSRPTPPPPPPTRKMGGIFGAAETKESVRAREDYETYMRGWRDGRYGACGDATLSQRVNTANLRKQLAETFDENGNTSMGKAEAFLFGMRTVLPALLDELDSRRVAPDALEQP